MTLTIQIHDPVDGWIDAAELRQYGKNEVSFEYETDYACRFLGRKDSNALSLCYPVQLDLWTCEMPPFLLDLIPQGQMLKRLLRRYNIDSDRDVWSILSTVPLASPGNIRIFEAWEDIEQKRMAYSHKGFTRQEILKSGTSFLEYMEEYGSPIGGTSGAAGGAPKFMLREDACGRYHADGFLDDVLTQTAWMVKLPFTDSDNSKLLNETEKKYYDLLISLPLNAADPIEIEGHTLFVRRFDRQRLADQRLHYFGLESFYSAHGIREFGASLWHEDNLLLIDSHSTCPEDDIIEYIKRDLTFRALSNTDNHGRNSSFIKADNMVRLSKIYDVTAMRFFEADPIVPLTRWTPENTDINTRLDWIVTNTSCSEARLYQQLQELREYIHDLELLLRKFQVDETIIQRSYDDRRSVQDEMDRVSPM